MRLKQKIWPQEGDREHYHSLPNLLSWQLNVLWGEWHLGLRQSLRPEASDVLDDRLHPPCEVEGSVGVTTSQTSWPRDAAAGRARRFSADCCHRSPPGPGSSPRYTNTKNHRNTRHSRPAGRRPALAGRAPPPGSGRCRRCRRRWSAGRTPGCGGTRPPSLCSGWTRCCRSGEDEMTWNRWNAASWNRVHLSDDYTVISETINTLVTSVSAQWHFLFFTHYVWRHRTAFIDMFAECPFSFLSVIIILRQCWNNRNCCWIKDLYLESSERLNMPVCAFIQIILQ